MKKTDIDYPHVASGLVIAAAFIGLMALIFSTQVRAQTCDLDCTPDGERIIGPGKKIIDFFQSKGEARAIWTQGTQGWKFGNTPAEKCKTVPAAK